MNEEESSIADALGSIAMWLKFLGNGGVTEMGAIEGHAVMVKEAGEAIAAALGDVASALSDVAEAIRERK